MTEEYGARGFGALMTQRLRLNVTRARIDDPNLLIFACRHQLWPIPVEARAEHDIGMTVHVKENLAGANIPDHHLIIGAGREQNIQRRRMPQHETDASLMVEQVDDRFGEGAR